MVSKYYKIRNKSGGNDSIKPLQLYLPVYGLAFGDNIGNMPSGDHCAVLGMTTIEGTQRSERFFLTLEHLDFTLPG